MSTEASELHEESIVVVGHSDIIASDVDWRRESGERGVDVGGPDCIGIGPDLMENWDASVFTAATERSSTVNGISAMRMKWTYPKGVRSNAELPNLTEGLLKLGFSTQDIVKFLGGNFMRVFDAVWKSGGANSASECAGQTKEATI